jgi:predicted transcriptional regulator
MPGALEACWSIVLRNAMTKLLEKAIAQVRTLPPEDQDALAAVLLSMTDEGAGIAPLDDETRAAIREGLEQARRGEFVPDADIAALWKRFGP